MFKIKHIETNQIYTVYQIHHDIYDTFFLIYIVDNAIGWLWVRAKEYIPYEEPITTPAVPYIPVPYPDGNWWNRPNIIYTADNKTE